MVDFLYFSPINSLRIVAGLYSLTSFQDNVQTKYLSTITVHPLYNSDTSENDIAILQVKFLNHVIFFK